MLILNYGNFFQLLTEASSCSLEELHDKRKRLKNILEKQLLPADNYSQVKDVSLDDIFSIAQDCEGFSGLDFFHTEKMTQAIFDRTVTSNERPVYRVL